MILSKNDKINKLDLINKKILISGKAGSGKTHRMLEFISDLKNDNFVYFITKWHKLELENMLKNLNISYTPIYLGELNTNYIQEINNCIERKENIIIFVDIDIQNFDKVISKLKKIFKESLFLFIRNNRYIFLDEIEIIEKPIFENTNDFFLELMSDLLKNYKKLFVSVQENPKRSHKIKMFDMHLKSINNYHFSLETI